MENQQLIAKARSHVGTITPRDASPLSPDDFPRVRVRETAMVYFESDERRDQVFVFLDRNTGEFVTIMYEQRKSTEGALECGGRVSSIIGHRE